MNPNLVNDPRLEGFYVRKPIERMRHLQKEAYGELLCHGEPTLNEHNLYQIPETYYEPNAPTPVFRNHEAMFTHDPRDPESTPEPKSIEHELFKLSNARERKVKYQQRKDGIAYSP